MKLTIAFPDYLKINTLEHYKVILHILYFIEICYK